MEGEFGASARPVIMTSPCKSHKPKAADLPLPSVAGLHSSAMIVKVFSAAKPMEAAPARGWDAERQMAFYLARAFEPARDITVFNGFRFAVPGSVPDDC